MYLISVFNSHGPQVAVSFRGGRAKLGWLGSSFEPFPPITPQRVCVCVIRVPGCWLAYEGRKSLLPLPLWLC